MNDMISNILEYGQLTPAQIELISSRSQRLKLEKGAWFSEVGKVARQVGFLVTGIMRVCYYNKAGDEFTRCFIQQNRFAVDMNSFYNETPCGEYLEALTDCEMLVISRDDFHALAAAIPQWSDMFSKMTSRALMNKMHMSTLMLNQDATTRYLSFMEFHPGLINQVPLSIIASYIGITQSSLSRIRRTSQKVSLM